MQSLCQYYSNLRSDILNDLALEFIPVPLKVITE